MAQQLESGNLGDITSALKTEAISDLSWLDLTNGEDYDNIPSEFNHEKVPELEAIWSVEEVNPFQLIPSQAADAGKSTKNVGPDDIYDVARIAKRAMMQGMPGKEVVAHLRERFPAEVLEAASGELKKVASEEGLLGNVYIDLSAFDTTKEALQQLGHHKVRLASFAIGAPTKEKNFTDSFGKCRNLAKTVVASVQYTPEVLSHYERHLKNTGAIDKTASIGSKADLQTAFRNSRLRKVAQAPQENKSVVAVDESVVSEALSSLKSHSASVRQKEAAQIRLAKVRPVLAKIQNMMLKGMTKDKLKAAIASAYDSSVIAAYAPEIKKLVASQGLTGPLFVDISAYGDVTSAVDAIKSASMQPRYIISTMPTQDGFNESVAAKAGVPMFNHGEDKVTVKDASQVVLALQGSGKLSDREACHLLDLLNEQGESPVKIIRHAVLNGGQMAPEAPIAIGQQGYLGQGNRVQNPVMDRMNIKLAATAAFKKGYSADAVQAKIASMIPIGEAMTIVNSALSSMEKLSANTLNDCRTQKYNLNRNVVLASADKCAGCIHHIGTSCSKQGASFDEAFKAPSASAPIANPAAEFGLSAGDLSIDLGSLIKPASVPPVGNMNNLNYGMGDLNF